MNEGSNLVYPMPVGAADEILMITDEDTAGGKVPHCCSCSVANSYHPA